MTDSMWANRRRHAFTLIELLVVVSIIALLVAILLPALGRAKEYARRSMCATQQKQILTMVYMYAQENDNVLPHIVHDAHWEAQNQLRFTFPSTLASDLNYYCGLGLLVNSGILTDGDLGDVVNCPSARAHRIPGASTGVSNYYWRYQAGTTSTTAWAKLDNVETRTVWLVDAIGLHGGGWSGSFWHNDGMNVGRADASVAWHQDDGHVIRDAFLPGSPLDGYTGACPYLVRRVLYCLDREIEVTLF